MAITPDRSGNPFSSSQARPPGGEFLGPYPAALEMRDPPLSVWTAVGALAMFLVTGLAALGLYLQQGQSILLLLAQIVIQGAVIYGILIRHRFAWQWGRIIAIASAVISTVVLIVVVANPTIRAEMHRLGGPLRLVLLGVQATALYIAFFALGSRTAKRYFRLVCPNCRVTTHRPNDFLFKRARCWKCGSIW